MEIRSKQNEQTAHALGDLAVALRISQRTLTEAANKIGDKEIVKLFYELALQQAGWERELNDLLSTHQELPAEITSPSFPPLQNVLMRVRETIYGDDYVVLCELAQVVDAIVGRYEEVLAQQGSRANRILRRHYEQLVPGSDAIARLRDRRTPAVPD